MNDDDPREVLALLKAEHRRLDQEIELLGQTGNCDQLELARMKKRKLTLKETSVGVLPEQADFDDYRDVGGVKIPFVVRQSGPSGPPPVGRRHVPHPPSGSKR